MNLPHIVQAVYFSPWNITPEGWQAVHAIVRKHLLSEDGPNKVELRKFAAIEDATDIFGEPICKMEIRPDGVAIIPIMGTLLHHASLMDKQCGACSYDDIKRDVRAALNASVNQIVLHVDSPGGMSMGAQECGRVVAEAAQFCKVIAVTDSLMCSAAYEVCAAADKIYCTSTASVGSIGTYLAWMDQTVRYEMAGLKVEMFKSGDLKGAGYPGTELTPEQREHFQSLVNRFSGMFKDHVQQYRLVDESAMRGQAVLGVDAVDCGLVDDLIEDPEECCEAD